MIVNFAIEYGIVGILSFIVLTFSKEYKDQALSDYILHFEPIFFDQQFLRDRHRTSKRSIMNDHATLQLFAFNRVFRLHLKKDEWVFAKDTKFENSNSTVHYNKERAVSGFVEGMKGSSVHAVVHDSGLLDGTIKVHDEEFFVEPAEKYFPHIQQFHSVIYKLSDISFPQINRTCISSVPKSRNSKSFQSHVRCKRHSEFDTDDMDQLLFKKPAFSSQDTHKKRTKSSNKLHSAQNKHHKPDQRTLNSRRKHFRKKHMQNHKSNYFESNFDEAFEPHSHHERAMEIFLEHDNFLPNSSANSPQRTNNSKIVSTTTFFSDKNPSTSSVSLTKLETNTEPEHILEDQDIPYWRELDALHYTEDGRTSLSSEPYGVRSIQRTQWFDDRGQRHVAVDRRKSTCLLYLQADHLFYQKMGSEEACIDAMTRHVQRVNSIYRTTDFDQDGRSDNISFLIKRIKVHTRPDDTDYRFVGNYGVEKFLELFSEDDYDAFCLAYMFTYRDFEGGTLGLAWTGDLKNAGGVCEKNGHYRGSLKSLNTGIITLLNYGKHVPPVVSHVTLAHEIGHNFGSPHDPEDDLHCTPGGDHGNYIMFARATSGDKRNNNKFSPCSLRSINAVLNTKARSVKGCFTEPLDAVCGNEVVEGTEECDCGWMDDCHEPCCFPMRINPPQDQPPCRLKPAAYCSPSQGPCCSDDCRLKYGLQCRQDNGCRTSSFCDGKGPLCPPSTKKPNKTICSEEFVCYNGECTGSICMAYGLESCQCIRGYHDPLVRSCELCCKFPGDESSCKSSFDWNTPPYDVPDLFAKPGAPCDNYNGYCDINQSCREIDPLGPLATLRNLLMSPEGVAILKKWVAEKWWSMLLLFFGAMITVVLTIRLISHHHTKNFLSTIIPEQSICNIRSSPRTCVVTSPEHVHVGKNGDRTSRPRVSAAPENGWV